MTNDDVRFDDLWDDYPLHVAAAIADLRRTMRVGSNTLPNKEPGTTDAGQAGGPAVAKVGGRAARI